MPNNKPEGHRPSGRTNLASCLVATLFLLFILIVTLIVFFTLFKPKDPNITVNAVIFPSFSVSNSTVNFTFSQYLSVKNPNRAAVFSHYDSSLQLIYAGDQVVENAWTFTIKVGFMFIPAGKIYSGKTQQMAATFSVQSFLIAVSSPMSTAAVDGGGMNGGGAIEIESRIAMVGRIRVLHFFTHHVESKAWCRVIVGVSDGSVFGVHC